MDLLHLLHTRRKAMQQYFEWSDIQDDIRMFAFSRGICCRKTPHDEYGSMHPLPITVFPTAIDRKCFQLANNLQPSVNAIIMNLSRDDQILEKSLKSLPDEFVQRLYGIYETVRKEGYSAKHQMGIFRSDYMIDEHRQLKQVEVNTISSGFISLAPQVEQLHRYALKNYAGFDEQQVEQFITPNTSLDDVVQSLFDAHNIYVNSYSNSDQCSLLFLIHEQESNMMDQKMVEFGLKAKAKHLKIYRRTFKQLDGKISIGPDKQLLLNATSNHQLTGQQTEISVVYFRTAYTTSNYSYENSWNLRLLIERSRAIKCPSIQLQLAGFKHFQTLLSDRKMFDRFVLDPNSPLSQQLYETYTRFWPIDNEAYQMAKNDPDRFVLKSNQEGGGNNVFGEEIITKMDDILKSGQNDAYFLMEFIKQKPIDALVVLRKFTNDEEPFKYYQIDSELGIYGTILFDSNEIIFNRNAGYLLRSKICGNREAGIMSADGILDTPFLSD